MQISKSEKKKILGPPSSQFLDTPLDIVLRLFFLNDLCIEQYDIQYMNVAARFRAFSGHLNKREIQSNYVRFGIYMYAYFNKTYLKQFYNIDFQ